jgi:hypothetical protein
MEISYLAVLMNSGKTLKSQSSSSYFLKVKNPVLTNEKLGLQLTFERLGI